MRRGRRAAAGLFALALAACGGGGEREDGGAARGATLSGTALDAATGSPLAGVRIEGPGGARAISGPEGRFQLTGLEPGLEGDLVGRLEDGRSARIKLRPLAEGRLEVVLRLERP